jgi:hypothetical protein
MSIGKEITDFDFGPLLSESRAPPVTVDGITTYDNGEHLIKIPKETLKKYERKTIKCDCKVQAKLIWSERRQKCFYVCRGIKNPKTLIKNKCKYVRRFQDVFCDYVEDELMETYG